MVIIGNVLAAKTNDFYKLHIVQKIDIWCKKSLHFSFFVVC